MKTAKYFKDAEFCKCSPACSIDDMDQAFLNLLDQIRAAAGIPLVINSAYRSREHERKMGRSGNSAHTHGLAVDIRCNSNANRARIIRAAIACGVTRIGIAATYVHIDTGDRVGLPGGVFWLYDTQYTLL